MNEISGVKGIMKLFLKITDVPGTHHDKNLYLTLANRQCCVVKVPFMMCENGKLNF